jgi:hypothetical protein
VLSSYVGANVPLIDDDGGLAVAQPVEDGAQFALPVHELAGLHRATVNERLGYHCLAGHDRLLSAGGKNTDWQDYRIDYSALKRRRISGVALARQPSLTQTDVR